MPSFELPMRGSRNEPPPKPSLLARAAQGPRELPKEVFWLVFKFWRSTRDAPP